MFEAIACPDCFANYGFRQTVQAFCQVLDGICTQCGSSNMLKVDREGLARALNRFLVGGSYIVGTYAPVFQINEFKDPLLRFDPTLSSDTELVHRLIGLTAFHYAPPLWRVGVTELAREFDAGDALQHWAAADLVTAAEHLVLGEDVQLFRVRLNPKIGDAEAICREMDAPPSHVTRDPGRWDDLDHPALYVSDDIELCLHEVGVKISDEIVVGTLVPTGDLRLLDLTKPIRWRGDGTPFDDPNIFVGTMLRQRGKWLNYSRKISRIAQESGYHGVRYTSYYGQAKQTNKALNLALFGFPIRDGILRVQSINRLLIADMTYQYGFGPLLNVPTSI